MTKVTDVLQLIYDKLDEILNTLKKNNQGATERVEPQAKPISQEKFNTAMKAVVKEVNKRGRGK